jgi:hypothetical protein
VIVKTYRDFIAEDGAAPTNTVGGGAIAGTTGSPPVSKAKQKTYQQKGAEGEALYVQNARRLLAPSPGLGGISSCISGGKM